MKKLLLICFLLSFASLSFAQEYKYHPIFIYNFSKYIEWPPDNASKDFVISVVGNNTAYREMLGIMEKKKTIKNRNLVVKKCANLTEVEQSDVVFVTKYEKVEENELTAMLHNKGTLLITEHDNMAANGSHINFIITDDSKIGFELNSGSAESAGLKVSSSLAGLAKKTY
ncbi:putative XRE-type DNA-binding protein [Catalinimonas alkaloidigena]|uniref:YfiR family protein n=1 Tax=Catalinimonas alkaloidigena TaxID=1075417 RepID=UPI002405F604|nr:YfiR family protein [Catalinimonas alkaloidigena]MDF9797356.1 putative XRE-type DNA-binding protein [Catalinimonas alkaloidigena]